MLRKMSLRKISIASMALFALMLLYLMPDSNNFKINLDNSDVSYVYDNSMEVIYLIDSNDYVARTVIKGCDCDKVDTARDVLNGLIIDGKKNDIIPNGFRSIIPSDAEILDLNLDNGVLTINFSHEFLDVSSKYEEKMLEAIIYSMTSIKGIDKVVIMVEGEVLNKLPNSGKSIPSSLDRSYGINKVYELNNTFNIDSYTIYYSSSYNDYNYYVPVTKYINNEKQDKVKIIISELSTSPLYETNLMSYLNANTKLINYNLNDDVLSLNFNNSILNDSSNKILEEVIYSVSLSINDLYTNVKEVDFLVEDKEIYKNLVKDIE